VYQSSDLLAAVMRVPTMTTISRFKHYLQLTKPSIMLLVLVTGATGLVMEGSLTAQPAKFLLVMLGLFCTGGSANALNQYFERDIDGRMTRTRKRRPLPMGHISAASALGFAILIGIAGVAILAVCFNIFSALLALGTVVFYGFFYTLWLKPITHQNIVIGGAAGAMAPVIAWVAASGSLAIAPCLLFLIIFLWTPPHFWALALCLKEDYEKVNLPMLPVVKGDEATLTQMYYYTLALVAISFGLLAYGMGLLYLVVAAVLGAVFIRKAFTARKYRTLALERGLFRYSIVYLFVLFFAIIVEGIVAF